MIVQPPSSNALAKSGPVFPKLNDEIKVLVQKHTAKAPVNLGCTKFGFEEKSTTMPVEIGGLRCSIGECIKGCFDLGWKKIKCSLYKCAENKGINSCGACQEFPCLEHYSSDQVYAKKKLLNWKEREMVGDDKKRA